VFAPGLALLLTWGFAFAGMVANLAEAPKTFYVSKLDDNPDGRSWATAFATIRKALLAIPDASGGYRIVVRPDTIKVKGFVRLSYCQQPLVGGLGWQFVAPLLQQPRPVPARAHAQPLRNPGQRQRRLRTQLPG